LNAPTPFGSCRFPVSVKLLDITTGEPPNDIVKLLRT
jgi:hypothetical protein